MAGSCGEVFCRWGGGDSLWGAASRLLGGWEAFRGYASHKCRLIPPHQSLARQTACSFLSPEGKPSICCANMANMALHCGLPLRSALIILSCSAKRLSQKGFPSGGSWRRRRLMRRDQSPPTIAQNATTSYVQLKRNDTWVVPYNRVTGARVRRYIRPHPTHKTSATSALC